MKRSSAILDQFGKPLQYDRPKQHRRVANMTYDAADENESISRHFANADGLSARAANSPEVRRKLRNRARHESDNGGNCKGTIETIAHDTIGTGPRLQMLLPDAPEGLSNWIETEHREWCDDPAIDYTDSLRLMVETEYRDGEVFGIATSNDRATSAVKLNVNVFEGEMCATPTLNMMDMNAVDGIEFDKDGNPRAYHILKQHPGDNFIAFGNLEYTSVSAANVFHWFRKYRPGQFRGVPRIAPGLTLIAGIRSFSRSVLGAARIAAMLAGVMTTTLPPEEGSDAVDAYDVIPLQQDALLSLPNGWDINQLKAEQPTTNYESYRNANLTEFGRGIHAPRNIVTGDSSPYNYSSARLDHIIYRVAIRVERNRLAIRVLDRVFKLWLAEALAIPGYVPDAYASYLRANSKKLKWRWQYDGFESIDPVKDATATQISLETGMTTYADALAEKGKDWREHFHQLAKERELAESLGITDLVFPKRGSAVGTQAANPVDSSSGPVGQSDVDTVLDDDDDVMPASRGRREYNHA